MELWGGHECTVNRIGDVFGDQTVLTGHDARPEDLERFAALGLTALRYPLLWERIAPHHPAQFDWAWTDDRLARLRPSGIRPIAGLVHHGSGPRYTDLFDPDFATKLAHFAYATAIRYDWIRDWTPVNEPLTTARFSALYGHWYPHARDERLFWTALLNQIDGIRLAMRAIRAVNPDARLIQTEDLGRSWATAPLRHQAAFDNSRRWMTWDLLCAKVVPGHTLWDRLVGFGLGDRLRVIADDPCPPGLIGINHYLTSDRFLDHRVQDYPHDVIGGNGELRYADVAAVRALWPATPGLRGALEEVWQRYGVPVALTEVHNGCTRDEQMRWMAEAWAIAGDLRAQGVAVEAVTTWALLGSQGWDTLLTGHGRYEAGAFDVRGDAPPRLTGLGALLPGLAGGDAAPPGALGQGWWRRPTRLLHRPVPRPANMRAMVENRPDAVHARRAVLVCGATGTLGQALARACRHRDLAYVLTDRQQLDLADVTSIETALDRHRPWAVINATGWVRVDDAEDDPSACFAANSDGALRLAAACAERDIPTVHFSSDLVFDGMKGSPYCEADLTAPLGVYGLSKQAAERGLAALRGDHLVIRTAAFFSPADPRNFAMQVVNALRAGELFHAPVDQIVSPTYVPHLCDATLDLLIDRATAIWHLTNENATSWHGFAQDIAVRCGFDPASIRPSPAGATRAERPASVPLVSARGRLLPPLHEAIDAFAASI